MNQLTNEQLIALEGGRCIDGPGNSDGHAAVGCTGLCLAGVLAFINSDGNSALPPIAC